MTMSPSRSADRLGLAWASILLLLLGFPEARAQGRQLVLRNVTVIDPAAASVEMARQSGRSIVIEGERIVSVLPSEAAVPLGAHVVDATGKFALPAFWDMHAHVPGEEEHARAALKTQFANGVLHMRDMGTDMELGDLKTLKTLTWKRREPLARIVATPWRIAHGRSGGKRQDAGSEGLFRIENPGEARALVEFAKEQGLDFLKPYDSMPGAAYRALVHAGRRFGMVVSGHVPREVPVSEAIALGQVAIEHAQSLTWACAPKSDGARRTYYLSDPRRRFGGNLDYPDFAKFTADVVDFYDREACAALMKAMADRRVHYVPTLVTRRFDVLAAFREYRTDPLLAYIDVDSRRNWERDAANYAALDPGTRIALYRFLLHAMALTADAHRLGVPILVGSDSPDSYIFPGFSYHLEMEMLAEAGLPPLAVLHAATAGAARFMAEEDDYGAITPRRIADIVILDADPLSDISHTRRIHAVVAAGRLWDRSALDRLLAEVRETAAEIEGEHDAH